MADELSRNQLLDLAKELKVQIFDLETGAADLTRQAQERRATLFKVHAQIQHIDSLPTPEEVVKAVETAAEEGQDTDASPESQED